MSFYITKQFKQRREETKLETFHTKDEALILINEKLDFDKSHRMQTIYRLYDDLDALLQTFDTDTSTTVAKSDSSTSSGAGKGSGFNPTPFNTAPRPSGVPHNWISDEKKDREDEKKD